MAYEHRGEPLITRRQFAVRLGRHFLVTLSLVAVSLAIGIVGYHALAAFLMDRLLPERGDAAWRHGARGRYPGLGGQDLRWRVRALCGADAHRGSCRSCWRRSCIA